MKSYKIVILLGIFTLSCSTILLTIQSESDLSIFDDTFTSQAPLFRGGKGPTSERLQNLYEIEQRKNNKETTPQLMKASPKHKNSPQHSFVNNIVNNLSRKESRPMDEKVSKESKEGIETKNDNFIGSSNSKTETKQEETQQNENLLQESPLLDSDIMDSGLYHDVHVFYYPWYANLKIDGEWKHWNHNILPHWDKLIKQQYLHSVKYTPPDDIGANFYPLRGPYSSLDPEILDAHFRELRGYVIVVSWWGRPHEKSADGEGYQTDLTMKAIFEHAEKWGAKIAFHLEPYEGRNASTVRLDLEYIEEKYAKSPAFYRDERRGNRPVIYLYDSYHTPSSEWATLFDPNSPDTIRGSKIDAIILALFLETERDKKFIVDGYFEGGYTYFVADGFTQGSSSINWNSVSNWFKENDKLFSISVGPGYEDTKIRPWNHLNRRDRAGGKYYDDHWQKAVGCQPSFISVTSYNEWHEGTQIEPSIEKTIPSTLMKKDEPYKYEDFGDLGPYYYMKETLKWAKLYHKMKE